MAVTPHLMGGDYPKKLNTPHLMRGVTLFFSEKKLHYLHLTPFATASPEMPPPFPEMPPPFPEMPPAFEKIQRRFFFCAALSVKNAVRAFIRLITTSSSHLRHHPVQVVQHSAATSHPQKSPPTFRHIPPQSCG